MSYSSLALVADSTQFTSSTSLSPEVNKPASQPETHPGNAQHPTVSSPTNAELAVILRPYLLG